jgi:hypothetical protein
VSLMADTEEECRGPAKVRVTFPSMTGEKLQFKYNSHGVEPYAEDDPHEGAE